MKQNLDTIKMVGLGSDLIANRNNPMKLYYLEINQKNGFKKIKVYRFVNNDLIQFFEIQIKDSDFTEESIQAWLNNNGFGNKKYEMIGCLLAPY